MTEATITLTPEEMVRLLGVENDDAPVLASGPIRVPATWPDEWSKRLGPVELTTRDVAIVTGRPIRTVQFWMKRKTNPLRYRTVNGHGKAISPGALVEFLRSLQPTDPKPVETPAQFQRRATKAKERARAACQG